jgi:RNA polymerase sigma-70 factor, ECF subfamily
MHSRAFAFPLDSARLERFHGVVDKHRRLVGRSLLRSGVRAADLDDAVQEVLVVAARRLDDVEPARERAFLLGTVARVASTLRRTRRRHPEDPTEALDDHAAESPNPEELNGAHSAEGLLRGLLDGLRSESRTVLLLAELEELPRRDVARRLGIPLGTVNSRLRRARAELRVAAVRLQARTRFTRTAALSLAP